MQTLPELRWLSCFFFIDFAFIDCTSVHVPLDPLDVFIRKTDEVLFRQSNRFLPASLFTCFETLFHNPTEAVYLIAQSFDFLAQSNELARDGRRGFRGRGIDWRAGLTKFRHERLVVLQLDSQAGELCSEGLDEIFQCCVILTYGQVQGAVHSPVFSPMTSRSLPWLPVLAVSTSTFARSSSASSSRTRRRDTEFSFSNALNLACRVAKEAGIPASHQLVSII